VVLEAETRLGPPEIAVLASVGAEQVLVRTAPRISIATTGDELVEVGTAILPHQIHRSNDRFLAAALGAHGFQVSNSVHLPDDPELLEAGLGDLLRSSDVLLVAGGVSVSSRDFVPQVLALLGCGCLAHGVAQKPGKPLWVETGPDGQIVFALPGNPVAVAMCFVRHVLRCCFGTSRAHGRSASERLWEASGHDEISRVPGAGRWQRGLDRQRGPWEWIGRLPAPGGCRRIPGNPPGPELPAGSVARFWPW